MSNTENFKEAARKAFGDKVLQDALANFQERIGKATAAAYGNLPEGPGLRLKAHDIRMEALENLDILLEMLADKIRARGGQVYFAETARDAVDYCLGVAGSHNVKLAVKGKSMVSEEIGLNHALQDAGIEVAETDLGEYIIQLAGERPSHIIAPAIHKTREQIGRLFAGKLGIPYTEDPPSLTQAARKALREKFLAADIGFSGCNMACAETGHITTVSNEGNIRMSTTLPKVHIALMGMERIVARLEDHDALFRLLARGAAAQNMPGYVTYIGGPRQPGEEDGPDEFHLVIIDNGRSKILADPEFREALCCIRCAACLNVCPVYRKIGGHSYGFTYCGPIGAVVTPLLVGVNRAGDLCQGEVLCGACRDACPIHVDLPRMILRLRSLLADGDETWQVVRSSRSEKLLFMMWSWLVRSRTAYDAALRLAGFVQKFCPGEKTRLSRLPYPFHGWTQSRDIRRLAPVSFNQRWKDTHGRKN